jgi:hypothetical protein
LSGEVSAMEAVHTIANAIATMNTAMKPFF